jgi:hypothetical protein
MEKNNSAINSWFQRESFVKYIWNICWNIPVLTSKTITNIFNSLWPLNSHDVYLWAYNILLEEYYSMKDFLDFRFTLWTDPKNIPIKLSHTTLLHYQNQVFLIKDSIFYVWCLLLADRIKSYDIQNAKELLYDLKDFFLFDRKYFQLLSDIEIEMNDFIFSNNTDFFQENIFMILSKVWQK